MYITAITGGSFYNKYAYLKPQKQNVNNTQIVFGESKDYFDYDAVFNKNLQKRPKWKILLGLGKKRAKQDTILELIGYNSAQKSIDMAKEKLYQAEKDKLAQQEKMLKIEQEKNKLLQERLDEAKAHQADKALIMKLEKEKNEAAAKYEQSLNDIEKSKANFEKLQQEQSKLTKREKGKGWDKIAGYGKLKTQIEEVFINKIALEKIGEDVNMPNGILLYGQHGTGKTRFAEAFAQQADCNFVKIDTLKDEDEIIYDLKNALIEARNNYNSEKTPKKRTIILLDDFNSIAQISDEERDEMDAGVKDFKETNVGKLTKLLENCADRYKATIFMTTNHPRKINSRLLNQKLIPYQIFLGPPNNIDSAKILKYHAQDYTDQEIDYGKLGNDVTRVIENEEAYSAQGIVNVVEYAKKSNKEGQITQTDLEQAIKNVPPDISKKTFNDFLDDMVNAYYDYAKKNKEI